MNKLKGGYFLANLRRGNRKVSKNSPSGSVVFLSDFFLEK